MEDKIFNLYTIWSNGNRITPMMKYMKDNTGKTEGELNHYIDILKRKGKITTKKDKEKTWKDRFRYFIDRLRSISPFQIAMYFLFVSCLITSVKYSYDWRVDEVSHYWALLTSFTMVLYGAIGFPAVSYYGLRKGVKGLIITTSMLVLIFSMAQTIAGQYKGFNKADEVVLGDGLATKEKALQRLNESRERVLKDLEKVYENKKVFDDFEKLAYFKSRYNTIIEEEDKLKKEFKIIEGKIITKEDEIITYKFENKTTVKADFFAWITTSILRNIEAEVLKFWFYLFPAIFVDIMGPIALYIAINRNSKRKQNG